MLSLGEERKWDSEATKLCLLSDALLFFCLFVCLFVTYGDLYELDRIRLGDARVYPPLDQVDQD